VPPRSRRPATPATPLGRVRRWIEAAIAVSAAAACCVLLLGPYLASLPPLAGPPLTRTLPVGPTPSAAAPMASAGGYLREVSAGRKLLGVAPAGIKTSLAPLNSFARRIGRQPDVVEFYQGFTEPFDTPVATGASRTGALPLDSWGPAGANLAALAAGAYDAYLASFADQVRDYGGPLALTIGHEMNAPWSAWWGGGPGRTASTFAAAWRRIHAVFAREGAANVIWVWTVNIEAGGAVSPDPYFPGPGYVDWIGVDGYFHPGLPATFDALFGPTLADLRAHYARPVLVVETGALDRRLRPAEIQSAFDAVLASRDLIGFIWFDYDLRSTDGVDWYVDDDQPSITVYRRNASAAPFALGAPVTADTAPFYPGSTS
jgi:mannan endo-1,4-beta-mannosidase